jgi:hypothetical protein
MLTQSLKKNLLVLKNEYILEFPIQIFSNVDFNAVKNNKKLISDKKTAKLTKPILKSSKKFKDKKISLKFPLQINLYNDIKDLSFSSFNIKNKNIVLKNNNLFFQKTNLLLINKYNSKLMFLNLVLVFRNFWLKPLNKDILLSLS